jgi:hypothetical protein
VEIGLSGMVIYGAFDEVIGVLGTGFISLSRRVDKSDPLGITFFNFQEIRGGIGRW